VSVPACLHSLGRVLEIVGLAFVLPTLVAAGYLESPVPFLVPGAVALGLGFLLERTCRGRGRAGTREAFLIVALAWLVTALIGTLPYVLASRGIGHWVDALVESSAGLTTSNVSVVSDDPGRLTRSLLFWRQFSQWLGGLGVIVLTLAVLPRLRIGGREPTAEERPGQEVERLSRGVREVARRFGLFYLSLTVVAAIALLLVDLFDADDRMHPFDAFGLAFSAVSTGGFSTRAGSLVEFSAVTQAVLAAVMLLAGANLVLVFRALVRRKGRPLARDNETRLYLAVAVTGAIAVAVALLAEKVEAMHDIGAGAFQSVSFLTTTGFSSANIASWPTAAAAVLVGLALIGGCAASLAGSQKLLRVLVIGKLLHRELVRTVHPETVRHIRINRRPLAERAVVGVTVFVLIFFGLLAVGTLALELDAARIDQHLNVFPAIADATAALANAGPGLGFAGPMGSFAPFSDVAKLILSALMLLGRVEIVPIAVLFTRSYWRA
jgi:trk system potassium uptake protein TrkH